MTNNKPNDVLLPCPFCGQVPIITKHHREEMYSFMHRCEVPGPISRDFREDPADHVRMWNTRAQPADQQGEPVAERSPVVGNFYNWRGRGRCEYIGTTRDIDGWLPTFRFQNGKERAMGPEEFSVELEEFAQPATAKVVLPEHRSSPGQTGNDREDALSCARVPGWNACLDEVAKLNGGQS